MQNICELNLIGAPGALSDLSTLSAPGAPMSKCKIIDDKNNVHAKKIDTFTQTEVFMKDIKWIKMKKYIEEEKYNWVYLLLTMIRSE